MNYIFFLLLPVTFTKQRVQYLLIFCILLFFIFVGGGELCLQCLPVCFWSFFVKRCKRFTLYSFLVRIFLLMMKEDFIGFLFYRVIIFSDPGIGSTETTIKPKYVLPINKSFQFMISMSSLFACQIWCLFSCKEILLQPDITTKIMMLLFYLVVNGFMHEQWKFIGYFFDEDFSTSFTIRKKLKRK